LAVKRCAVSLTGGTFLDANILTVGVAVFVTNNAGIELPVDSVTILRSDRLARKFDNRRRKNASRPPA